MTRSERKMKRFFLSLAAGVLLVPLVSGGALAEEQNRGLHAKESRGIGHGEISRVPASDRAAGVHTAGERTAGVDSEARPAHGVACDPLVETDHPPFETYAEHKVFHGVATDIDHTNDPEFSSYAEHKVFHSLPCGLGVHDARNSATADARNSATPDDEVERAPHTEGDRPVTEVSDTESPAVDGAADSSQVEEQPHERTIESSDEERASTDSGTDKSQRSEERRGERTD